ncbi:septum formation initiator family protein [Streptomyces sp. GC420]|uniref:FtsB family cell division protein n=1 Tax=Streptomyces sp. GC420 TaxID=2697568 RepID=UPI001414EFCB|nr:septum formation initiator family protein [Streptomyces sp. GC420]NBM17964.1 septum formation initiator family protein [Streptomyces sp. GC420]
MSADRERFSTATRLKALGEQTAARVYRVQSRRVIRRGQGRLTGRAALLALVVCTLVVALAYPMRQWVSQRSDIEEQRRRAEQARERVEELRDAKARWQDPAYVEQQAREHLHYVRPGETGYTVVGPAADQGRTDDRDGAGRPWYENLWEDVDEADRPAE